MDGGMDGPPRIGRYTLVRRVGAGGFATVWLAYDEQLDAQVAVKVLSDNWIDEHDVRRRFLAEGRFLRRVDSPHVVGVHDVGETADGRPYLVLTYADGGSLADRIEAGPLPIGTVVDIVSQVGIGLQQLHDRGVLHRDVKPANVLFRSDPPGERAMLGDLGLGKSLESVSQLTMTGGTPAYVAPEQVMGDRLDQRADLYSLGAVAYAAFTGQVPHGVGSLHAVLHIAAPPPPMASLRAGIPAAVDAVVQRALELDRERRWPDLSSFLTALRAAYETGELPPGPVAAPGAGTSTGSATAAADSGRLGQETGLSTTRLFAVPVDPLAPAAVGSSAVAARPETALDGSVADGSVADGPAAGSSVGGSGTDGSGAGGSGAGGSADRSGPARPGGSSVEPAERSNGGRGRVVAGLAALVLAVGGGFAGYEVVSRRSVTVTDDSNRLSVKVPRSWSELADDGWTPPGQSAQAGMLVTTDTTAWQSSGAAGVFVGVLRAARLPTAVTTPAGCRPATGNPDNRRVGDATAVTFRFDCGGTTVVERFVQVTAQQALRIQVRAAPELAEDVLASATYRPK